MELVGRHATEAELANMASPFNTNTGPAWTAELIKECIDCGADIAEENPEIKNALEEGIKLLQIKQAQ